MSSTKNHHIPLSHTSVGITMPKTTHDYEWLTSQPSMVMTGGWFMIGIPTLWQFQKLNGHWTHYSLGFQGHSGIHREARKLRDLHGSSPWLFDRSDLLILPGPADLLWPSLTYSHCSSSLSSSDESGSWSSRKVCRMTFIIAKVPVRKTDTFWKGTLWNACYWYIQVNGENHITFALLEVLNPAS